MKAIVFAYHDIGCVGLQALVDAGYDVQAVFTHTDSPGENTFFASVARLGAELNLPVLAPDDVNHPLWVDYIRDLQPDIIFSFYYRNLLSEEILALAPLGGFNLHGSLLPKYRGRAPVNWALLQGETRTGVTLHKMVKRADAGDIAGQLAVDIAADDTALTLHSKLSEAAGLLLSTVLPQLKSGTLAFTPQKESDASYFGRRTAADGEIYWHNPAQDIANLVRAVTEPYPGAFSYLGQRKLVVWRARAVKVDHDKQPGTVLSAEPLTIACGLDALEIIAVQGETG